MSSPYSKDTPPNVGIVGATGMVGAMMRELLVERGFTYAALRLFASARSAGQTLDVNGADVIVEDVANADFAGLDIVFFSAGGGASKQYAPIAAAAGAIVIDNSSAWRDDPDCPLVVAEVNPDALNDIPKGIVANPNCTTMAAMPVLKPLHDKAGLKRMVAAAYMAASGGGVEGIEVLKEQLLAGAASDLGELAYRHDAVPLEAKKWAVPLAFNAVPLNYVVGDDGFTEEEAKLNHESRKILSIPDLRVSATCVRIPVFTGHALALNLDFDQPISVEEATALLENAPGVVVTEVPNPLEATGQDPVFVGRIRKDPVFDNGLVLFVAGDNLRKGAALNAVQIAEVLVHGEIAA